MRTRNFLFIITLCFCGIKMLYAQSDTRDDVHLFQTFFRDATVAENPYGDATVGFSDFDGGKITHVGVRGAFPINPQFEIAGGIAFVNEDPDNGSGESGITDLRVTGRYHLVTQGQTNISIGGFLTLPIGKEDLAQGEANFGGFGALRHPVGPRTVITGVASLDFLKGTPAASGGWPLLSIGGDREAVLLIGGGVIHEVNSQINIIGELNLATKGDFSMLNGGIDYKMQSGNRLRGTLGIGFDDGAPDLAIVGSFLHEFK
ncbi:MAG: hypothetical protein E2O79_01095 [Caldithrix sp.]|nr:MAG: hypothetical protein E2O79_01095 [Caldithrix sp.]